jgi:hypothetical protein
MTLVNVKSDLHSSYILLLGYDLSFLPFSCCIGGMFSFFNSSSNSYLELWQGMYDPLAKVSDHTDRNSLREQLDLLNRWVIVHISIIIIDLRRVSYGEQTNTAAISKKIDYDKSVTLLRLSQLLHENS